MSKTFTELFTELPTDLQRVVYQHLFSYCLEEIKNILICGACEYGRTIGDVVQDIKTSGRYMMEEIDEIIACGICRECFKKDFVFHGMIQKESNRLISVNHSTWDEVDEVQWLTWQPLTDDQIEMLKQELEDDE